MLLLLLFQLGRNERQEEEEDEDEEEEDDDEINQFCFLSLRFWPRLPTWEAGEDREEQRRLQRIQFSLSLSLSPE